MDSLRRHLSTKSNEITVNELIDEIYSIKDKITDQKYKSLMSLCQDINERMINNCKIFSITYISQKIKCCPSNEEWVEDDDVYHDYENHICPKIKHKNVYLKNNTSFSIEDLIEGFNNGILIGKVSLRFEENGPCKTRTSKTLLVDHFGTHFKYAYCYTKSGSIGNSIVSYQEIIPISFCICKA